MADLILRLGVALAIGLLVGLERGWRERDQPAGSRTAGFRTFGIFGLIGGLAAALAEIAVAPMLIGAVFVAFTAVFGLFQFHEARQEGNHSITSLAAGMAVFLLGALATAGDYRVAAAGATALAAILASREVLHQALTRLSWIEIRSALVLAAMTTIVLPLLPDRAIDPWGGFNPREVWLFTVLIAAISYLGYIAVRMLGARRGLLVSALAGALVSSTAVTVALARMARGDGPRLPLAGAAALAGTISVLRVAMVVALLAPGVAGAVAPAALAAAAVLAASGGLMLSSGLGAREPERQLRNPFELGPLLGFAAMFAAVSTLSAGLVGRFGAASLVISSVVSGMFDVDVAVLSALRLSDQAVPRPTVAAAVLAALAANALGRAGLAMMAGPTRFWLPLCGATAAALAAGAGVWALLAPALAGPAGPAG